MRLFIIIFSLLLIIPFSVQGDDSWFSFSIPWKENPENITNMKSVVCDAPAGKHGFLKVKNGHFFFEDGTHIRFWGINITAELNFPPHETAVVLAEHLAKTGFNIVRLHHIDSNPSPSGIFAKGSSEFSPEQLDRFDYFIAELKKRGIYVDMNLHVGRRYAARDGVVDADRLPRNSKVVTLFNEKFISLEKDYAEKLLTHRNPYTNTRYCDEPCMALVEITNENSLFSAWIGNALFGTSDNDREITEYYIKELDTKWNEFLAKKYHNNSELARAWNMGLIKRGVNLARDADFESGALKDWVIEQHKEVTASVAFDESEHNRGKTLRADITVGAGQEYQMQIKQLGIKLIKGKNYTLSFTAKSDIARQISVSFGMEKAPYTNYGLGGQISLTPEWQTYKIGFTANATTDDNTRLSFAVGKIASRVWLDQVNLSETEISGLGNAESIAKKNITRTPYRERIFITDGRFIDNCDFYASLEKSFATRMITYLKTNLKVKVPLSTTNEYYGIPSMYAQSLGDYIDVHSYWDHPGFPGKPFDDRNFRQNNNSFISMNSYTGPVNNTRANPLLQFSLIAMKDKPLTISEWNDVFPNDYEYEEMGILAAFASFQDWDGVFLYTLGHRVRDLDTDYVNGWFNSINDPVKMILNPLCATAFSKGYVTPSQKTHVFNYSTSDAYLTFRTNHRRDDFNLSGNIPLALAYHHGIRKGTLNAKKSSLPGEIISETESTEISDAKMHESDTREIIWNGTDKGKEFVTINSSSFQGAAGFLAARSIALKNLSFELDTDCSALLASVDGKEIGSSKKLILAIVAQEHNTGQKKDDKNGLASWGKAPVLMQRVRGKVSVSGTIPRKVYALDGSGNRLKEIKAANENGSFQFSVGEQDSCWYEISGE